MFPLFIPQKGKSGIKWKKTKGLRISNLRKPFDDNLIRETGLEPVRRKALEPKSNASASSATLAC